jgi:lantibiotic modifying enzyme
VVFHAELARASGLEEILDLARRGADELLAGLDGPDAMRENGLYTGIAGVGFALEVVHRVSGDDRYRAGAARVVDELIARAEEVEGGLRWSGSTDVISGSAGIGLFLLWAADAIERPDALEAARDAGGHLLTRAREQGAGLSWPMTPDYPRDMPNFSHGTAGVAFFLARLYAATGEQRFFDAAVKGARHLLAIADHAGGGLRVHHHSPGGEELYYYGWCHGPVGTARLFHQLGRVEGGEPWAQWVDRCVIALRESGLPTERVEGLWNNVGQCCGTAGVAQFLADRFRGSDEVDDRLLAEAFQADVVERAAQGEDGWSWPQAEHRAQPDLIQAQSGYMQGAAGIGLMLLHFDALQTGRGDVVRLPDDPFGA